MKIIKGNRDEEGGEGEEESDVKWAGHYSSIHHLLLVGEGDFSFSLSLAIAFGSASNIVATSLDSHDVLLKRYNKAESNLERLKEFGATILHDVDATKMKLHTGLKMKKFDRIIFNFPHAGFIGKEDNMIVINLHQKLVDGFFKNAIHMLRPEGEVHVSHKIGDTFNRWNLKELALGRSLVPTECVKFSIEDYPGYNNKRGDGNKSDQPFPLGECMTFKFRRNIRKNKRMELKPHIVCGSYQPNFCFDMEGFSRSVYGQPTCGVDNIYSEKPRGIEDPRRNFRPYMIEGVSSSVHRRPTSGIDHIYLEKHRSIEDILKNYRPYTIDVDDPLRNYPPYMIEGVSSSVHRQPTSVINNIYSEKPQSIDNPYMIEGVSSSVHHQPTSVINNIYSEKPRSIDDPPRNYRPYMREAPWNTEFHHPAVSTKYDLEEEIIMRLRMKTNFLSRSGLFG